MTMKLRSNTPAARSAIVHCVDRALSLIVIARVLVPGVGAEKPAAVAIESRSLWARHPAPVRRRHVCLPSRGVMSLTVVSRYLRAIQGCPPKGVRDGGTEHLPRLRPVDRRAQSCLLRRLG